MSIACPACHRPIASDDTNVTEGVAICRECGKVWRLSELARSLEDEGADRAAGLEPPPGCWIRDLGSTTLIGATSRSMSALGLGVMAVFWNSIVSVFLAMLIGSLYTHLVGTLPSWYPIGGSTPVHGPGTSTTVAGMSWGMTIFMLLFITPFVMIGAGMILATVFMTVGHVEVSLRGHEASVFSGVGPIGWRRSFDPAKVTSILVRDSTYQVNGQPQTRIVLTADRDIKVGIFLSDTRRQWLAGVLRKLLLNP